MRSVLSSMKVSLVCAMAIGCAGQGGDLDSTSGAAGSADEFGEPAAAEAAAIVRSCFTTTATILPASGSSIPARGCHVYQVGGPVLFSAQLEAAGTGLPSACTPRLALYRLTSSAKISTRYLPFVSPSNVSSFQSPRSGKYTASLIENVPVPQDSVYGLVVDFGTIGACSSTAFTLSHRNSGETRIGATPSEDTLAAFFARAQTQADESFDIAIADNGGDNDFEGTISTPLDRGAFSVVDHAIQSAIPDALQEDSESLASQYTCWMKQYRITDNRLGQTYALFVFDARNGECADEQPAIGDYEFGVAYLIGRRGVSATRLRSFFLQNSTRTEVAAFGVE